MFMYTLCNLYVCVHCMKFIFVHTLYNLILNVCNLLSQLFIRMNQPTIKWGPKEPENRTLPRYKLYLTSNGGKPGTPPGPEQIPSQEKFASKPDEDPSCDTLHLLEIHNSQGQDNGRDAKLLQL